jgi:hypothetical protein
MPNKLDKVKFDCPFFDKRVKLLPCQREMVHYWYGIGTSITKISKIFNVNKRLIQFELFPERKLKNMQHRMDRGGSMAYYKGGKDWADTMKRHRGHKYEVFNNQKQNTHGKI